MAPKVFSTLIEEPSIGLEQPTNNRNTINILSKSFINEVNLCSGVTKDDYEAGYAQCNMFDAWYSIQVNVAEFKIDMFNAFGVGLTYSSGDGD